MEGRFLTDRMSALSQKQTFRPVQCLAP